MNEHGFKFSRTFGDIQDYVTKWGHPPKDESRVWGVSSEMTRTHVKHGYDDHLTPFDLLEGFSNGDEPLGNVFVNYAHFFKGRKQLSGSKGFWKKYLPNEEELTDEVIANKEEEKSFAIYRGDMKQWRLICKHKKTWGVVGSCTIVYKDW